jgi:hypothetical protein
MVMDFEESKALAIAEKKRLEEERKELVREMSKKLKSDSNVKKLFQLGKDSLMTNFSKFVMEHYDDFEEVMMNMKEEKPQIFIKYFLEMQKNAFPLKKEEGVNIKNLNLINTLPPEELRKLAKGEVIDG